MSRARWPSSIGIIAALWLCACNAPSEAAPRPHAPPGPSAPTEPLQSNMAAPAPAANEPRTKDERSEALVVVAGGDVNLGRGVGQRILRDPSYQPFEAVLPLLTKADIALVNLESPLSRQKNNETMSPVNPKVFTGPPEGADVLSRAGIDLVSTANNHIWDYGKSGMLSTLDALGRVGILQAGASREPGQAHREARLLVQGWRVAFFAVTHIWNQGEFRLHRGRDYVAWADIERLRPEIARAKGESDLVIVSYHGGAEYVDVPMGWTREFVSSVMSAGADAVIGHHPHVPHGVGWFEDRPAFYSLGNLVFLPNAHRWTATSFLGRLVFHRDGRREVAACPYNLVGQAPAPFGGKDKALHELAFSRHLRMVSVTVGGTGLGPAGEDGCMSLEPPPAAR